MFKCYLYIYVINIIYYLCIYIILKETAELFVTNLWVDWVKERCQGDTADEEEGLPFYYYSSLLYAATARDYY